MVIKKKLFSFLFILLPFAGCSSVKTISSKKSFLISKHLQVEPLSERTFVVKDISFYDSNVLVTKMPDDTVIIASSPIDTVKTTDMIRWIKKSLSPKKVIAINTHFHADGTGGNEAYKKHDVEIWSTYQTDRLYSARAESMRLSLAKSIEDKQLSYNVLTRKDLPATHFFDLKENVRWKFGDEEIVIAYPGPAHSPDNIVVYLPTQGILFGGCMIRAFNWKTLGNTRDANILKYESSVKSLLGFQPKIVVPGHGKRGDTDLLKHTMTLARKARAREATKLSNPD